MCDFVLVHDWKPDESDNDQTLQGWIAGKQRSNSEVIPISPSPVAAAVEEVLAAESAKMVSLGQYMNENPDVFDSQLFSAVFSEFRLHNERAEEMLEMELPFCD